MNRKPKHRPSRSSIICIPHSTKPGSPFKHHIAVGMNAAKTHRVYLHATKGYKAEARA